MVDSTYANYLENVQQPAGWFDLVLVISAMISSNADERTTLEFLTDAGYQVSLRYPLPQEELLSDLQSSVNSRLDLFKWGMAEIEDCQDSLLIHHYYLPRDPKRNDGQFLKAMSAILCGLYTGWFHQSGASLQLSCRVEQLNAPEEVTFRFRNFTGPAGVYTRP